MYSIYYCQKCSIDFPSVTRYVKHRKFFCKLGRDEKDHLNEDIPEDGIGKLTIAEASKRISRAIERRAKEVDPAVYSIVEQVRLYKKKRRNNGKKINEKREEILKKVSLLKQELRDLEKSFYEKNKKYESIKAYSKVSAIEITGTEELVDELHDLKNAIIYLEDEIAANIDFLHCIDTGNYKPELQVAEQPATSEDVVTSKEGSREKNNCTHSHRTRQRSYQSTRERLVLPALPVRTPTLTPESPHSPTPGVTRDVTSSVTRSVTTAQFESETEVDGVHFRAASAPRVSVVQTAHSPRVSVVQTAHSPDVGVPSHPSLKPGSADSTVLLSKLQRKRDIIILQREIRAMELEEEGGVTEDVLSDSALISYVPNSGVAVYIDYLTPSFHIPANLVFTVLRDAVVISQSATFIMTPATHLTFLGYHEIFPNISPSNDIYLHCSIRTLEGEELGWCLFNIFSERELNSGAWRIPLKSPPFSKDLVSSLYHGVRSLNYSLRLRCSVATVHEAMLLATKLKLPQYKLHNPVFQDNLILSNSLEKKQKLQRNASEEKVTETYGPQDDFDPIKVMRKSVTSKLTPIRPMPAPAKSPTPSRSRPSEVPKRIKGLHYHTLLLNLPSLPPSLSVQVEYCEVDEEFNVRNVSTFPSSTANLTTQLHRYSPDYQTLELAWNPEEVLLLLSFKEKGGRLLGWSWTLYSDKKIELEVFEPPLPSFLQLAQWLEQEETGEGTGGKFTKLTNCSFHVRYYDSKESVARFPDRVGEDFKLPQPRIPTGAFRHVDQEPNFVVHSKEQFLTLVIDGARYLPSCVTISRVTGRIFDRDFNVVGPQISSSVVVDSDIYNPIYKYSVQIPGNLPSNSIVVLKLYSLHAITGQLTTIGYSLLNLFCKRGTVIGADSTDSSVVLNSGAWQLPLYIDGPDAGKPLTVESLKEVYCIPCSWLLLRLMYSSDDGSIPLMPSYNDGVYSDNHPNLSETEMYLLDSYRKRPIKNGRTVCNFNPTPAAVMKKLTRHKGQTIRDMSPAEIVEYSPEFGVGVKIVGIKNFDSRDSDSTILVYLRLSTRDTLLRFTDHMLFNESVQFNIGHKIKWWDQIHIFKHVIPSSDVFVLVQIVEHSHEQFVMVGWLTVPIFRHTGPSSYVNRTHRSEIPIIPGALDPAKLSLSADLKSELEMEVETPFAVLEVFDARFSSESRTSTMPYEVDPGYIKLAEKGVNFIASQMPEATEFVRAFAR